MALINDHYLGDGVYASYDGYQIWLDLRGQETGPPITLTLEDGSVQKLQMDRGPTRIALEPGVMMALLRFNNDVKLL